MGCCGCTLYASTVTAGILTLLDCVLFLTSDITVIVFITGNDNLVKPEDNSTFAHYINGFAQIKDESDHLTIVILLGIKVGLRIAWLLSAVLLLIGNAREYRKFLNVWKYLTTSKIVYSIAVSIYALVSLMEDMKRLFDDNKWDIDKDPENQKLVAKFTILIDFLELGPIWLIILIALVIFVHQRSHEIDTKKRGNVNHWGNFSNSNTINRANSNAPNGNVSSPLAHPVSLTQEPNPFTLTADIDNNNETTEPIIESKKRSPKPSNGVITPKVANKSTNELILKPVLQVNGVISIPRVKLDPNRPSPVSSRIQSFDNKTFDAKHDQKRHISSLAKRSSYFEYERDPNKVPKRNHSYNLAQTTGQKPKTQAYDNRAFDYKTESDLNRPVLIKRASVRRTQNQ